MTVVKKKIFVALLVVLMVVPYGLPNGFHLHVCPGEDRHGHWHWHVKPANDVFINHTPDASPEKLQLSSLAHDHCCADLATDNAKDLRSLISVPPGRNISVFSPLHLAWHALTLPMTGKPLVSLSRLPAQPPFQLPFLRTVILLI